MKKIRVVEAIIACVLICALVYATKGHTIRESQGGNVASGGTQKEQQKKEQNISIEDLSQEYEAILAKGTKEFYQNHPVDQAFLMWMTSAYGTETIKSIAEKLVKEESAGSEIWYETTGCSMHVLWAQYCSRYGMNKSQMGDIAAAKCVSEEEIVLDFIGDINLAEGWHTMDKLKEKGGAIEKCISKELIAELSGADITVANNEFTLSGQGEAAADKDYTFRAKPENVGILNTLGVDLAVLANNHTYDYGEKALLDTIVTLEGAGITTSGAGENIRQASLIHSVIANGRKIAFVSATEVEKYSDFTKEADATAAGVFKMLEPDLLLSVVEQADKNSDYVIVYAHWGKEGESTHSSEQHDLAQKIADAGADVIIGSHPHRLQGVEYIGDTVVVYSLGNFWFSTGTLYTAVAQVRINAQGKLSLTMLPCIQKNVTTKLITDKEQAEQFYKYLADMSTKIVYDAKGNVYNLGISEEDTQKTLAQLKKEGTFFASGQEYSKHSSGYDVEGRQIDVVGNLK